MSNDWFRSWHGAPTDNKWLLIAKRAGVKPIHVSGTWWALLDHASQHSERGRVDDFDVETFALFAGMEEEHVSRIVTTLCDKGLIVDGFINQWMKRQPKKEDPTATERQARSRANKGKNGGNPPFGGKNGNPDDTGNGERHALSRDVTLDTDKIREDSSVANATGTVVPHPASDFCKAVFESGIALLRRDDPDMLERQARSIVGRWRKTVTDPELMTILMEAETKSHTLEWVMAAVETRNGRPAHKSSVSQVRGTRPSPALDLWREAQAELAAEAACRDQESRGGNWLALPAQRGG